jgi:hypothetical protein
MVAANSPLGQVQAFRMRLSKLDSNGVPTPAAGKMYVTSSLVLATFTPSYIDGTLIRETNGAGEICVEFEGDDSFLGYDVSIQVCTPDPYIMDFLGSCSIITPSDGPLGWAAPAAGPLSPTPVSIELWSKRVDEGSLASDGYPYFWTVAPRVRKLRLGPLNYGNQANMPTFTGIARENPNWFDGPLNNWDHASDKALHQIATTETTVPAASNNTSTIAAS